MTSVSKNVYIGKLDYKDPEFRIGDIVRISKYKNILV